MDGPVLVYTTWPTLISAEQAGRSFVEDGLAACINIFPGMISIYIWNDAVQRDGETVMIIKTISNYVEPLRQAVRACHSYDVPAFLVVQTVDADPGYAAWISAATGASRSSADR